MLRVSLLCVGRLKERFYLDACGEYAKRLSRYCQLEITELPEQGDVEREGEALLSRLPAGARVVALCVEGESCSSEALAAALRDGMSGGCSRLCVLIGGSNGLSQAVKRRAHRRLSMSPMTFPHHLARVMALEQLYRAFSINEGTKYHK